MGWLKRDFREKMDTYVWLNDFATAAWPAVHMYCVNMNKHSCAHDLMYVFQKSDEERVHYVKCSLGFFP